MSVIKKLSAFRRKGTEVQIGDATFRFYPVRMSTLLSGDLKAFFEPMAEAFSIFFDKREHDVDHLRHIEAGENGEFVERSGSISLDLAQFRAGQKTEATRKLFSTLFSTETRDKLARLIIDSLREEYPQGATAEAIREFVESDIDLPTFVEFLKGFLQGNTALFGVEGNKIGDLVKKAVADAVATVSQNSPQSETPQTLQDGLAVAAPYLDNSDRSEEEPKS